jgi:enoyl-CoA hydratase/carnithine racemase
VPEPPVLVADEEGVRVLTLNRPRSLNALNGPLIVQLHEALSSAPPPNVLVLAGAGDSFCAGGDRKEGIGIDGDVRRALELLQGIARLLRRPEVISIAAVRGWVVGGGLELAIACDLVVAGADSRFRMPDAQVGAHATGGATWLLPRTVGLQRANQLMFAETTLDARTAMAWGLVAEVTEVENPLPRTIQLAKAVAAMPGGSLQETKKSMTLGLETDMETSLRREATTTESLLDGGEFVLPSPDAQ